MHLHLTLADVRNPADPFFSRDAPRHRLRERGSPRAWGDKRCRRIALFPISPELLPRIEQAAAVGDIGDQISQYYLATIRALGGVFQRTRWGGLGTKLDVGFTWRSRRLTTCAGVVRRQGYRAPQTAC